MHRWSLFVSAVVLLGCRTHLGSRPDSGASDGRPDARVATDANVTIDAFGGSDSAHDASSLDASTLDASVPDAFANAPDAGRLPCDPRFALSPLPARASIPLEVRFTDATPYVYIGLRASGAGRARVEGGPITGMGPYTWAFTVHDLAPGRLELAFTADMDSRVIGTCALWVEPAPAGLDAGVDASMRRDAGPLTSPPTNRFGIGLVGPGDTADLDRTADLAGPGGFVKLIFPGIVASTPGPEPAWSNAIRDAYARDLIPVVRLGPPWGDRFVRDQADPGSGHMRYTALAAAYRRVVEGLPLRPGWPIYLEIHNEPNLCYEWPCRAGSVPGGWITGAQMAAEYAAMLRDVADALHAIGDARIRVINGGLAPGGVRRCQCGGDGWEGGNTTLDFLRDMARAVPGVFDRLDGFASHSYPAEGFGYAFFVPYERAGVGLRVFERELEAIGRPSLDVFLTETGWCQPGARCTENGGSREQIAEWTERAYTDFWLVHPRVRAVMPFMLRDPGWDDFAWMDPSGSPYPVYTRVRALRCRMIPGRCP